MTDEFQYSLKFKLLTVAQQFNITFSAVRDLPLLHACQLNMCVNYFSSPEDCYPEKLQSPVSTHV